MTCKRCLEVHRKRLVTARKRGSRTAPNQPGCRCRSMTCITCVNRELYRARRRRATGRLLECDLREGEIPIQRRRQKPPVVLTKPSRAPFDRRRYDWDRTKGKRENWHVD